MKLITKCLFIFYILLIISSCASKNTLPTKVFENAQAQNQEKSISKIAEIYMPSYFLVLDYYNGENNLEKKQLKKINSLIDGLPYTDEYNLYLSLGVKSDDTNQFNNVLNVNKRASILKKFFSKKFKSFKKVDIVILANQPINTLYFRVVS